jgi:hypothetical protein
MKPMSAGALVGTNLASDERTETLTVFRLKRDAVAYRKSKPWGRLWRLVRVEIREVLPPAPGGGA